ncbi:MAG: energy transducer TonB [Flavobacteriales bacterium]
MEIKKNPDVDINKKLPSLKMMGLLVALAFTLTAFEYTVFEKEELALTYDTTNDDLLDEQVVDIPPPPPPPAPPPPPMIVTEIKTVEDDKKVDNVQTFQETDVNDKIDIVDVKVEEAPVVEEIFDVVEEQAEFPGGMEKLRDFLSANLKFPPMAKESGVQGKVYVQFVVFKDGSVGDIKVLRGIGSGCDEEAVRVVKSMPKWNPGKQRGRAVSSRFTLPINFKLQ